MESLSDCLSNALWHIAWGSLCKNLLYISNSKKERWKDKREKENDLVRILSPLSSS